MRKILIFLVFSLVACNSNPVAEPDHLLKEEEMVDILYDLAILQASESHSSIKLRQKGVEVQSFIFDKYKIDSTTFYQNQRYYASNVRKYKKIYQQVLDRISEQLDEGKEPSEEKTDKDSLDKKQKRGLIERAASKKDSITKNLPLE
ncbi:DUF4296 domain-containing protein [Flavobacterium sp. U410]|jgi:hypothetical protein